MRWFTRKPISEGAGRQILRRRVPDVNRPREWGAIIEIEADLADEAERSLCITLVEQAMDQFMEDMVVLGVPVIISATLNRGGTDGQDATAGV